MRSIWYSSLFSLGFTFFSKRTMYGEIVKSVKQIIRILEFEFQQEIPVNTILWSIGYVFANLGLCLVGLWKHVADNYLHWAATCTWLLLNLQGFSFVISLKKHSLIFYIFQRFHWWRHRLCWTWVPCLVRSFHSLCAICDASASLKMVYDKWNYHCSHSHCYYVSGEATTDRHENLMHRLVVRR